MTDPAARLVAALSDHYRLERDIGLADAVTVYPRAFDWKPPEVACAE